MRVIMFQDRFSGKVSDGSKPHTIRKTARCKPGDVLSLRRWTGKPYRSKQETIRTETCLSVLPVHMAIERGFGFSVCVNGRGINARERDELARADGFANARAMERWFIDAHGLPFDGFLIRWLPLTERIQEQNQ